jgi:hypothetical protein
LTEKSGFLRTYKIAIQSSAAISVSMISGREDWAIVGVVRSAVLNRQQSSARKINLLDINLLLIGNPSPQGR